MGKTTVEQSKNKYNVVNKLLHPEAINERELNAIAGGLFENLIPVHAVLNKKGVALTSSIVDMTTLQSYFSGVVSKKMFLDVIAQLVAVVKECEKNLMNVNNLMLDCQSIFLDPRTKKIKCIFWPIVNNQNPYGLADFFSDLPFRVVFTKHEDHGYISTYLHYFKSNAIFSINGFEKTVFEIIGKPIENKSYLPSDSRKIGDRNRSFAKPEDGKSIDALVAYDPFSAPEVKEVVSKFCSHCGKQYMESSTFCVYCGRPVNKVESPLTPTPAPEPVADEPETRKADTQSFSETTVLGAEPYDGGTTVLGADSGEEPIFPYLIREKTEEKVSVDKPSFRIGKESQYCDYFISNNNAISRSHADIITKDSRYYIIDHNSTNKTYVEGRAIPVEKEVEIFSGTKLRLANEDFVFYI
ncbi:FHA domain-containing protein [Bacillus sp. OK048]|uniref:FHA domain-containing protein n=1 Tax=Bacillus sp. OK048 TaxID=1882761 RepID=UPI00088084C0|nr:FHA domain-containing protein [Bacillus sp. OK048]SDM85156.1 zinc-ribbon domain-containing protein [Bacillus sp. OK048]